MTSIKDFISAAATHFCDSPAAVFKAFLAAVLFQFALLSFMSIAVPAQASALPVLRAIMSTAEYWWGLLSIVGALFLFLEYHVRHWVAGLVLGYGAALVSFGALVYDFMYHRPPIFAGGILAATAALFIGGLMYERFRRS